VGTQNRKQAMNSLVSEQENWLEDKMPFKKGPCSVHTV
jgi:hypothetical protein